MINNTNAGKKRTFLPVRMSRLYYPRGCDWSYSHHASLGAFRGKLYAMWSNGMTNEDHPGQRVLFSVSEDGENWSEPKLLMSPCPEEAVLTAGGFYDNGEKLIAYAGYYRYSDAHVFELGHESRDVTLLCITTEDGSCWSEPQDLQIPIVPNHGPQKAANGRLIISGNAMFPYSDDPSGLKGWNLTGVSPFPWEPLYDDCEGIGIRAAYCKQKAVCEGSFFRTDDGILHMLLRTAEKRLAVSESEDNGSTWSDIRDTGFVDSGAKFHCGRLPDGRFYIVGNPDPDKPRCPLVISTSKNGIDFDREYIVDDRMSAPRIRGYGKGGVFGYPHSLIVGDTLFIICSHNKEDIHVYRIPLKDLEESE